MKNAPFCLKSGVFVMFMVALVFFKWPWIKYIASNLEAATLQKEKQTT